MTIPSVITRMHAEALDLSGKIERAMTFLSTETYKGLPKIEKALFNKQINHMMAYRAVLLERLELVRERNGL